MKDNIEQSESSEKDAENILKVETPLIVPHGSGTGGGTRAGLFRTPISGGVQSATSAHGLPRPALAVRNLMEQVMAILLFLQNLVIAWNCLILCL
jgi:isopentenyl phosphate kinase